MDEFKIGDKVKILREYSGYSSGLIATVGKIGKITKALECSVLVYFEDIKASFFYFNKNLELVNDEDTSPKYTYEDVIIDPNDPRVEIGAEYWFCDCPNDTVKRLNNAKAAKNGHLSSVKSNEGLPFYDEDSRCWLCIIRKKELTYEERQDEWIKTYNVQVGDKVRVIRKAKTNENGWGDVWDCEYMDPSVNKVLEVVETKGIAGISLDCGRVNCCFPYFVLEKVEEPVFKVGDFVRTEYETIGVITEIIAHDFVVVRTNNFSYFNLSKSRLEHIKAHLEPFDLEDKDTRKNLLGIWIKHYRLNDGLTERQIVGFDVNSEQYLILGDARIEPEVALSHEWTFMDGSPCGLVVEDEQ